MRKTAPAPSPDAYVAALDGWRRDLAERLRAAVRSVGGLTEVIKWGHLVYLSDGPVLLIRAEDKRVLLGFWRGQRLRDLEPRLTPGGQYEMATLSLTEDDAVNPEAVAALARAAIDLNARLSDPTKPLKKETT